MGTLVPHGLSVTKGWGLGAGRRLCQEHSTCCAHRRVSAGAARAGSGQMGYKGGRGWGLMEADATPYEEGLACGKQ